MADKVNLAGSASPDSTVSGTVALAGAMTTAVTWAAAMVNVADPCVTVDVQVDELHADGKAAATVVAGEAGVTATAKNSPAARGVVGEDANVAIPEPPLQDQFMIDVTTGDVPSE
jgi:hypothetical protein